MVKRFMVYEVNVNDEIKPCVVVSPDELNNVLPYVMVAPVTSKIRPLPYRILIEMKGRDAQIALDQIRTRPKSDFLRKLGRLPEPCQVEIMRVLHQFFE
ncbi:MAG: type II toxin-antitoxin system PemK/MazF family toxin [Alphaproteobacteria bacterium]|nr:type II toxin-antitoxin system PemK/MazF family toxin [Alphaproteobacteria bacterium]